jgi:hypothetical protein
MIYFVNYMIHLYIFGQHFYNVQKGVELYKRAKKSCKVGKCGLVPHSEFPMLAASPDGLVLHSGMFQLNTNNIRYIHRIINSHIAYIRNRNIY